jgi:serine/threonine-protein kinase
MVYEMIAGSLPFQGEDPDQLLHHHVHTPPPRIDRCVGEAVPPEIESLVLACMEKEPAHRPSHMGDIIDVLARY